MKQTPGRRNDLRTMAVRLSALACAGALALSGCGGSDDEGVSEDPDGASTTGSGGGSAEVSNEALGEALSQLIFQGSDVDVAALGDEEKDCLASEARSSGLSDTTLVYLVDNTGAPLSDVIDEVHGSNPDDATILFGTALRDAFDACVGIPTPGTEGQDSTEDPAAPDEGPDEGAEGAEGAEGDQAYEPPADAPGGSAGAPDLRPSVEIDDDETIASVSRLQPGLVTMFSSFAFDEAQRLQYEAAGSCLAEAVLDAEFSQASLRFIAGGAPLGVGSISEHLATPEDQALWESAEFTQKLVDCVADASAPEDSNA